MTRNLIVADPSENNWCMVSRIGSIGDTPKNIVTIDFMVKYMVG